MKKPETKKPVSFIFLYLILYPFILFSYITYMIFTGPYCRNGYGLFPIDCYVKYIIQIPILIAVIFALIFITIYFLNKKVETKANKFGPPILETKKKKIIPNTKIKI